MPQFHCIEWVYFKKVFYVCHIFQVNDWYHEYIYLLIYLFFEAGVVIYLHRPVISSQMRIYKSVIDTSTELCCGFFFSYMYNMHICHALYLIIFCNLAAMCGWDQAVELKKLLQVQEFQTFECVMDLLKNVLILYWEKMCIHIMVFSSYILIL